MNELVKLTAEEIHSRVFSGGNKFSKAEMSAHRTQIARIRKDRRANLGNMTMAQISARVATAVEAGFVVADEVQSQLKSKDKYVLTFERKKGDAGLRAKMAAQESELSELRKQLKALLGKGQSQTVEGVEA